MQWNEERSAESANFFTFVYSGRKTEELIAALLNNGVRTLVDIRQNPVGMYRPDLSKNNLARLLAGYGMNYEHFPQLGVPRDIRAKAIEFGTRDVIWNWYDQNVIGEFFGVGRNLSCTDSEIGESWRQWKKKYGDKWEEKFRER
jgi:hypothetical protein